MTLSSIRHLSPVWNNKRKYLMKWSIKEIGWWMERNKLKINKEKTEVLIVWYPAATL